MRRGALPFLLLAVAGCAGPAMPQGAHQGPPGNPLAWTFPDVPRIDAAPMLDRHAAFVTDHPQRSGNSTDHRDARASLAAEFGGIRGELWRRAYPGSPAGENICLRRVGQIQPDVAVVVLGHYDSAGARAGQGAYDNGAGVRMVVELARAFGEADPYYSALFCAIDGGDAGYSGSRTLLSDLQKDSRIGEIRAALFLDGYGLCWPLRSPIQLVHNSEPLAERVDAARRSLGVPDDHFRTSPTVFGGHLDEGPWIGVGVPTALLLCGIEETGVGGPQPLPAAVVPASYPFLHFADTVETMTLVAGGPDRLRAGFQTAIDLARSTSMGLLLDPGFLVAEPGSPKA